MQRKENDTYAQNKIHYVFTLKKAKKEKEKKNFFFLQ